MDEYCPQCKTLTNLPSNRLIQDACGHKKCRLCLLKDEVECRLCSQNDINNTDVEIANTPVITSLKCEERDKAVDVAKQKPKTKKENKRTYKHLTLPNYIKVTNDGLVLYTCTVCNKSFRTKSYIKHHQSCGGDSEPFSCSLCDKKFASKYRLEVHRVSSHSGKAPFACDICCKGFIERSKLKRHQLSHTNLKPFVCQHCGNSFRSKESLKAHSILHQGDNPFKCPQCKATFNNSSNFRKHLTTHSKEKPHMCDQCGKRFKQQAALKVHRKSHARLRPHKCHLCLKAFINAKELHRHQLVHIDAKAYTCSLCNTSFRRKDTMKRHVRNAHPGKTVAPIKKEIQLPPKPITDNPNAVNVIKSPMNEMKKKVATSKPVSVINAPLKLAFKTSAFKSHYNIVSREYVEESPVNIYQKILEPCSSPPRAVVIEKAEEEICPKILCPMIPPISNQFFESKPHAIKNIKFKLPPKYLNIARSSNEYITPLKPVQTDVNFNMDNEKDVVYTELRPAVTSNAPGVIVNGQMSQNEMHWRRRTLQNLSQSKSDSPPTIPI